VQDLLLAVEGEGHLRERRVEFYEFRVVSKIPGCASRQDSCAFFYRAGRLEWRTSYLVEGPGSGRCARKYRYIPQTCRYNIVRGYEYRSVLTLKK
jgi:hypothetical protein